MCLGMFKCLTLFFSFLKIVINCQIFTIQSQLWKECCSLFFYSYKIKAQEVTELFENAATFSNKFQLQLNVEYDFTIRSSAVNLYHSCLFQIIKHTFLSLFCFFSEVDLLVCFGWLSCWKARCVCHKLHILCQKGIQVLRQPQTSHQEKVWRATGMLFGKKKRAFHPKFTRIVFTQL